MSVRQSNSAHNKVTKAANITTKVTKDAQAYAIEGDEHLEYIQKCFLWMSIVH